MGADIGGRHTGTVVTTTHTRQRIVARIMEVMVITIQRLTMTLLRALTDGNKQPTAHTARQRAAPLTTLTPAPRPKRDRVRARTLRGVVPMCREETRALPRVITQQRMERWRARRIRREE